MSRRLHTDDELGRTTVFGRRVQTGLAATAVAAVALSVFAGVDGPAGAATSSATVGGTVLATTAGGFTDSVGVNTHTAYGRTTYGDTNRVVSLLRTLGVRHVRDGLTGDKSQVTALKALGAAGIHENAIVGADGKSSTVPADKLTAANQLAPYLDSIEPTNEADCTPDSDWAGHLHAYSHSLAQTVRADSTLSSVPLLGPAFCRPESVAQYGSASADSTMGNAHDYARGGAPELTLESRLPAFSRVQDPGKPMVVTELGYHNAMSAKSGQPPVTAASAADYDVRTLLDAKRLGIARTYFYELLDERPQSDNSDPEQHFGLVDSDGTVKPAFIAIRNLLADIDNGNPAATAGQPATARIPAVDVAGGGSLLRSLQIADSNGTGQTVALWLATPLENLGTHERTADQSETVRVQVTGAATATTRRPSRGNDVVSLGHGQSFDVPVDGAVTLLHLATGTANTSGASEPTCTTNLDYSDRATQLGATVSNDLAPSSAWSGSPSQVNSIPGAGTKGAQITADGQLQHLAVPGTSARWTIALWERTDAASQSYATFLHISGAHGGMLRTYNLVDDVPSHHQISGSGLPAGNASYGTEGFANSLTGTWHMVSLTENGTSALFAVDGIVYGTMASTGKALTGIDVGSLTNGYRGAIGGLRVFPSALTQPQLLNLATGADLTCGPTTGGPTQPPTSTPPTSTPPTSTPPTSTPPTSTPPTSTPPTSTPPTSTPPTSTPPTSSGPKPKPTKGATVSRITGFVPHTVVNGHTTRLGARLMSPAGSVHGARLYLYARPAGSLRFTQVTSRATATNGVVKLTIRPHRSTTYRWVFRGSSAHRKAASTPHRITVTQPKHHLRHHVRHHRHH